MSGKQLPITASVLLGTLICLIVVPTLQARVPETTGVTGARIIQADKEPGNWLSHGRTYDEQRYSPLTQIHADNVSELGLAWFFDTAHHRGLEATPIVVDGVMYISGLWSRVYALDARSGEQLWLYDPQVPRETTARKACCDAVNRGVAVWEDKVYVGTLDGRLVALDSQSGQVEWSVQTVDPEQAYTITGAPRVVKGKVLIGNGGAEYGVRGYLSAYDAHTGELAWRFYTVPGNPEDGFENEAMRMAADTWTGEWWTLGGGGTVWDSMAYDPELDLLYVGVGNGSPWNRHLRSPDGGDNLFLASIVALRPDTGEYVWHYQVVPAETWDYTATQHMILADLEIQGEVRKVLMQAPKSGFFMVIDRTDGELISAEPFVEVNWASHYDLSSGRPVENPGMDYRDGKALVKPTSGGAHNWQPMAFNPETGLVYIPAMDAPMSFEGASEMRVESGLRNRGIIDEGAPPGNALFHDILRDKIAFGYLLAWDPVRQQEAWRIPQPVLWNGGVLTTAGNLVIQGTGDREFAIYRADTGEQLWSFTAQNGIIAPPVTYTVDGEQYITVLAGWGGAYGLMSGFKPPPGAAKSRVLTFKLNGQAQLPPLPPEPAPEAPPPRLTIDRERLDRGADLYHKYCAFCHGVLAVSGSGIIDLRYLPSQFHDNFDLIVRQGAMARLGMPAFGDVLNEQDVEDIHAYVIDRAHTDRAIEDESGWVAALRRQYYRVLSWLIATFLGASSSSA